MRILIDADSVYFKMCCVTKKKQDLRKGIDRKMREIINNCQFFEEEVEVKVGIKGKGNYRHNYCATYKGRRPELDQEMKDSLAYCLEYMESKWEAVPAHGMEADDLVCIWAYEAMEDGEPYVMAHIDKDLDQIPGLHYNFDSQKLYDITAEEGHKKLMLQALTGDRTDNIPGIKGIGPKKAEKILEGVPVERMWNRVRAAWRAHKAGNPLVSYNMLRMVQTWEEFNVWRDKYDLET